MRPDTCASLSDEDPAFLANRLGRARECGSPGSTRTIISSTHGIAECVSNCGNTSLQFTAVICNCGHFVGNNWARELRGSGLYFNGGAAGNRTRVLRHSLEASPCAVRYVSTRISCSREQVRMTIPVAVSVPISPATELSGRSL